MRSERTANNSLGTNRTSEQTELGVGLGKRAALLTIINACFARLPTDNPKKTRVNCDNQNCLRNSNSSICRHNRQMQRTKIYRMYVRSITWKKNLHWVYSEEVRSLIAWEKPPSPEAAFDSVFDLRNSMILIAEF